MGSSNPAPHQCNPGGCNPPPPIVPDFDALECKLHQLAFEFGSARVPTSPQAFHDALRLGNCSDHVDAAAIGRILAAPPPVRGELPSGNGADTTLYVATTGSDSSGIGSEAAPFASLHAAAAAIRKAGSSSGTTVLVRQGKYYFNKTLTLGVADSHVRWAAYRGERVTLSGGQRLELSWKPFQGKIMRAAVDPSGLLSAAEAEHLAAPPPPPSTPHVWGPPPAKWNTLHVDGVRQVRARFPNGDAQQASGLCFSKANHPGEGCGGYLAAQGQAGGSLPAGTAGATVTFPLDRCDAAKHTPRCNTFGALPLPLTNCRVSCVPVGSQLRH